MKKIVVLLAVAIVTVIVLLSFPTFAADCSNGCGVFKSKFL